jgi:hypothetical protein
VIPPVVVGAEHPVLVASLVVPNQRRVEEDPDVPIVLSYRRVAEVTGRQFFVYVPRTHVVNYEVVASLLFGHGHSEQKNQ